MTEQPLISVIVPVYNTEKYIKDCLDSLLVQSEKNIEILVVDDGSKDNCPNILKQYAEKNPIINVFTQENAGPGAARNIAIKKAKKVFKYLLDTDFIKDATYDPFPEMEKYNNMKFLVDEAALLNTYIMASSYELNNKNFTIDDEYGEGITDDMLQQLGITVGNMEGEKI